MAKITNEGYYFDAWIKRLMHKNDIRGFDDLSKRLGVSRQTLYKWRCSGLPNMVVVAGIKSMLGDDEHDLEHLDFLCKNGAKNTRKM